MRSRMIVSMMVLGLPVLAGRVEAQSVRSLVNGGNDLYKEQKYGDAEANYRKALEKERGLVEGHYNLGNALYKEGKLDESLTEFEQAASKTDRKSVQARAMYNRGNSLVKSGKYQDAISSYIDALKINPSDQDTKYNLSYALTKLRQQQQQQNQQQKQQNNKDQDKQNQQQQQQNQQQQQQDQKQQQPQQQEKRMSKQEAERILDVVKNSERDVQKKLRVRQATRAKTDKDW